MSNVVSKETKMIKAKIIGTGKYSPKRIVTNKEMEGIVETTDEWIFSRTGIKERRIAVTEKASEMGVYASSDAILSAGINPEDIDLIIVATATSEYIFPSMACLIQKEIGAKNAMAFDITAACSGFVFALHTASKFIESGSYKNALVVGSEKLSQITNWEDRSTCVIFGDGAGAAILSASDDYGIIASECKSVGEDYECLTCGKPTISTPFYEKEESSPFMIMEGREVFEFACKTVPKCIEGLLEVSNLQKTDISTYILHQANTRIITTVAKKLGENLDKFYMNIELNGNTSAASVAIALDELNKTGTLAGQKVVLAGFGAGLTYGACIIQF